MAEVYLLMEGDYYYPQGSDDIRGVYGEWERAIAAAAKQRDDPELFNFDWSEVVEVEEGCDPITIAFRNNSTDGAWKQVHYID